MGGWVSGCEGRFHPCSGIASEEQFLSSAVHTGWGPGEFEGAAVVRMKEIAAKLIDYGVGFVGCQKVIHPVVKQLLRRKVICTQQEVVSTYCRCSLA